MAFLKSVRRPLQAAATTTMLGAALIGCSIAAATPTAVTQRSTVSHRQSPIVSHHASQPVTIRPAQPTDNHVFVVGDSLTVGTEPWLRADLSRAGWSLTNVNARVGRPVDEGLAVLRTTAARLPSTVVVALGTNNLGASAAIVGQWLREARRIAGSRRLVWVNTCPSAIAGQQRMAGARLINAALQTFAPRFRVQVADWCAFAARHGIVPGPDGIHYSPTGYQARAAFYAAVLGVRHRGAGPTTRAMSRAIA